MQVPGRRPSDCFHLRAHRTERVIRHHCHMGADRVARLARVGPTRRGHVHVLQHRAHVVHIPGPGPKHPAGRLQQARVPGKDGTPIVAPARYLHNWAITPLIL